MTHGDACHIRDWLRVEYDKNDKGLYSNFNIQLFPWNQKSEFLEFFVERNEIGYPIGYLIFNTSAGQIDQLSVMESERFNGIGTKLVKKCLKWARDEDFEKVRLLSVNLSYPFWRKFGFDFETNDKWAEENAKDGCQTWMIKTPV